MSFIPETPKNKGTAVVFYEDAIASDGWQGQTTTKSLERLKTEVITSIERLGGVVRSFQRGTFQGDGYDRDGFRISYHIQGNDGKLYPGQVDIAALPVKNDYRSRSTQDMRKDRSLRMALYMLKIAMDGTWFLQQLSPGYSALMPWMLT